MNNQNPDQKLPTEPTGEPTGEPTETIANWSAQALDRVQNQLTMAQGILFKTKRNRNLWTGISAGSAIFLILHYTKILTLPTWLLVIIWIIGVLLLLAVIGTDVEKTEAQIERLESAKRSYEGLLGINEEATYFDRLVQINVDNLSEYYSLVKIHTSQSFKTCIFAGGIGFFFIVLGVAIGYFNQNLKDISYLAAGAGIITEFISGIFFYLYSKTVRQLKQYHDALLDVQNVLMSFRLVDGLQNQERKAEMIKSMIQYLIDKSKTQRKSSNGVIKED